LNTSTKKAKVNIPKDFGFRFESDAQRDSVPQQDQIPALSRELKIVATLMMLFHESNAH
jgi:hypothetical protein